MKKSKSIIQLSLSALFVFGMLASCSEESDTVMAPEQAGEETVEIVQMPSEAELVNSVETGEVVEDISNLPFPKQSTSNARVAAGGVTDYVDFNDQMALSIIPDQAQYTFASSPFYIQQVGNAWVHVKENNSGNYSPALKSNYGHYHLSYQNFTPCVKPNGQFGKPHGGGCMNINPVLEPRKVDTHHGTQWIKIYAYDYDHPKRTFDLLEIKVTNGPIQLWYKKAGGNWYKWSSLGTGTWNLSAYSTGITEVLISGTGNSSIGFDNVKVTIPVTNPPFNPTTLIE